MFKSNYSKKLFEMLAFLVKKGDTVNNKQYLYPHPDPERDMDELKELFKTFSTDQAVAVGTALLGNENVLSITGKAGVGKTYFITTLREILEDYFLANIIVCASTGIASQNCKGAGTLHSVFGIGTGNKLPWDLEETKDEAKGYKFPRNNTQKTATFNPQNSPFTFGKFNNKLPTYIIIDEISMASSEVLHILYQVALYKTGAALSLSKSTQNIKLICCGDVMQLLPVDKNTDAFGKRKKNVKNRQISSVPWETATWNLGDGNYHTEPSLLKEGYSNYVSDFTTKNLSLISNHRQNDKDFIDALNYIRLGGLITEGPGRFLLSRLTSKVTPPDTKDTIHVYYSNKEFIERNKEVLNSIPDNEKASFKASVSYTPIKGTRCSGQVTQVVQFKGKTTLTVQDKTKDKEYEVPSNWLPDWAIPNEVLGLGLPFMIRQNIPSLNVFNGTVGKIVEFTQHGIMLELDNGREVDLVPQVCHGVGFNYDGSPMGTYTALPGHLACGLTGHKCIEESQRVLTNVGDIPIKDIEAGDLVWTGFSWKSVLAKVFTGSNVVYNVKTLSGQSLLATADHPLLVYNKNDLKPDNYFSPSYKSVADIKYSYNKFFTFNAPTSLLSLDSIFKDSTQEIKPSDDIKSFYTLDEIVSIEEVGLRNTYDIEVDLDHCFCTEGFIVRNCQGLTIRKPLVAHINPTHAKYASPHWIYVVLSRVTDPELLYIDGSPSVINQYIKINSSALEFSRESESNMQAECNSFILADSFSPYEVKNSIPIMTSYDISSSDTYIFFFEVFIEVDEKITFNAEYDLSSKAISQYYDNDLKCYITPEKFEWNNICTEKVLKVVESLEEAK